MQIKSKYGYKAAIWLVLLGLLGVNLGCAESFSLPTPVVTLSPAFTATATATLPSTVTVTTTATATSTVTATPNPFDEECDFCVMKHATVAPPTVRPTERPAGEEPTAPVPTETAPPPAPNTVTPEPTSLPVAPSALALWETELTLQSYGWENALIPSTPEKPYHPYPELNFDAVEPPSPRTYAAVVLENAYTRVVVLPALGGRILRWEDKVTGRRLTYENPVLKPTRWGYRGWWLATGGLEWAFPVNEHGLNEYRPWQYELLSGSDWRGVRVWDTDERTGMRVAVTLQLHAGRSVLSITPQLSNPTDKAQALQFWINAMLTLSDGNAPSENLRFWVPTTQMMVHSTSDGTLPGPRAVIGWPSYAGRDFSRYAEWHHYLGLFATQIAGAAGAYDTGSDQGIVRAYPPQVALGMKIFGLGELSSALYTDDGSRYFEFWGGYNRTFFPEDDRVLPAGSTVSWQESWYPVHGIGGLDWANDEVAVAFTQKGSGVDVGVYAARQVELALVLRQGGAVVAEFRPRLGPGAPFHQHQAGVGDSWVLEVLQQGELLAEISP